MQQTWDNRSRGNQFLLQLASQSPKYFFAEARAPRHASLRHAKLCHEPCHARAVPPLSRRLTWLACGENCLFYWFRKCLQIEENM
jgi:hypothetical protein